MRRGFLAYPRQQASAAVELHLTHLYDAFLHTIDLSSTAIPPLPSSTRQLLPEILPFVVAQLDPRVKAHLPLLLTIQRSSKYGWEVVTPILYRDITVKNWHAFLRMPKGLPNGNHPHTSNKPYVTPAHHARSFKRRLLALTYVQKATFEVFHSAINEQLHSHPALPCALRQR